MEGKDIVTGLMSNPLDLREIFYTNLLLLGFDSEAEEANYRIPLNRDMFVFPNKKAMEIVCHFLFCQLDPQLAFQEFRDCWPIQDKKMEQQFRKSCNSWLSKIYKDDQDSNLPRIGPSLFLSPGGDRFYELMFYFSSFVLRRVMARDHGKHGKIPHVCKKTARNPNMTRMASKAMTVKTLAEKNRFFEEAQYALEVQEHWKSYAVSSTKEYRKLSKQNRELERRLNPKGHVSYSKDKTTFEEEAGALHRTKKLQEVRELWSKIQNFYDSTKEKRAILDEILKGNEELFTIDGSEIQLQIPEVLMTEYKHYIQMKNIGNTYQAGKLNLLSLIQLCNLALHQIKEKLREDGIQSFEQFAPFVINEVHGHAVHLTNAKNLRSVLSEDIIPELKKSIDNLKEECYANLDERSHSPAVTLESFNFGLGLLPASPSPAFAPATTNQAIRDDSILAENMLRKRLPYKDTPDAVENLTTSVREMVIKDKEQSDETFDTKHISERSVEGSELPKPFLSKIPKPVSRKTSQTPDAFSRRTTSRVKRMSVSTTKKPKKSQRAGIVDVKVNNTMSEIHSPTTNVGTSKVVPENRPSSVKGVKVFPMNGEISSKADYTTPLKPGLKSALKKNSTPARQVLAEKIAKAVFADGPTISVGNSSSQSSSGENTPKDLGIADPLGHLSEEPFQSKDLIPRTPFKGDSYLDVEEHESDYSKHFVEVRDDASCFAEISRDQSSPQYRTPSKTDPISRNPDIFSTTNTCSPFIGSQEKMINGSSSAKRTTPDETRTFGISWQTPRISPSNTPNNYTYTPIESKLTVVDIDTPYSVTPAGGETRFLARSSAKSSRQPDILTQAGAESPVQRFTLSEKFNSRTTNDTVEPADNLLDFLKSSSAHEGSSPVVSETGGSPLSGQTKVTPDSFFVTPSRRITNADKSSFLTSVPRMTTPSNAIRSPLESSFADLPTLLAGEKNINPKLDYRTAQQRSANSRLGVDERTSPFEISRTPLLLGMSKANVPTVGSESPQTSVTRVSTAEEEKQSEINDLVLRYQQLKKAQEVASSPNTTGNDDVARVTQSPTSGTPSWGLAAPLTTFVTTPITLGNSDRDLLFGETPLNEIAPPVDLNSNSLKTREKVASRLFVEDSPVFPSAVDTSPKLFSIHSPSVNGAEKSDGGLFSVGDIFTEQHLNLVSVDTGDVFGEELDNGQRYTVQRSPEEITHSSFNIQNEQDMANQLDLERELTNGGPHRSEILTSVEVGQLIDLD